MRDVDWRMCLRCMSEGEDGQPMVAPTNASEVQRKMDGLNPLRRCAPAPLDAIKGSLIRCGGDRRTESSAPTTAAAEFSPPVCAERRQPPLRRGGL